jgi:hypothetical protein
MTLTRQMLRRLVREEIMRAVEEERQAKRAAAQTKQNRLEPTLAILMTGPAGLSDRMAKAIGQAIRAGHVGWLAADEFFLKSACGQGLANRLGLLPDNMPPVWRPEEIAWESRKASKVKTLWAMPISLSSLAGFTSGTLLHGGRALYGAIARNWSVSLVGHPHRAEGMPALRPGDALAAQERELLAQATRFGCDHRTLEDIEKAIEALALEAKMAASRPVGPVFLTVQDVEEMAREGAKHLLLDVKTRITPLAEDRARELGLSIVRPS